MEVMGIEAFGRRSYGSGEIVHVPFVRAGKWVFGTGLRATLPDGRMDPSVALADRPLGAPPKAQREATAVFGAMAEHLHAAGSSMRLVSRLDQYYPDPRSVDPYHVARKQALAGQVAPSTSVIVRRLLNLDASLDVQVLAATSDSGYEVRNAAEGRLNAPATSGY